MTEFHLTCMNKRNRSIMESFLEKICMYINENFPKYTGNIYVFITYKVFNIFFYSELIVNWKNKNIRFVLVKS